MKNIARRVTSLAAVALVVAAGSLMPTMASANSSLAAPDVEGTAFYNGDSASFEIDWTAVGPTHVDGTVVSGYEGRLLTGAPAFDINTPVATTTSTSITDGSVLFTGLTIGQKYQAAVRAVYTIDGGAGPDTTDYSNWSYSDVGFALYPAPNPLAVSAKATAAGVVTVTWKKPSVPANTEGIGGYGVGASPTMSIDDIFNNDYQYESYSKSADADHTSARLTGLRPGVTYDIVVFTYGDNPSGFSFGSSGASTTVKVLGKPNAPTKLKVKTLSKTSSKVSWTGAKVTKGGPVDGYKVYVNGKLKKTVGKSSRSYTAHGQKAGKTYKYTVKAYNKVGSSSAASISKKHPKS